MNKVIVVILTFLNLVVYGQEKRDSSVQIGKKIITLSEVVVGSNFSVDTFIEHVKNDTSFYKAFKNLRVLQFSAINDIRMLTKSGQTKASLLSKTVQVRNNNCRSMKILEEEIKGDIYDENKNFNYYTAQMYASLFFTKQPVCGENNIVGNAAFAIKGKTGMEKHKEQLKTLFFNPGKKINGIPFLSNKTEIFDDDIVDRYDMGIDMDSYNNINCYIFKQKVKPGKEDDVVIDEMVTWFDEKTYEVVARNYTLSYNAKLYDFNVQMEVVMARFNGLTVPSLIRYHGNWKAIFKKREIGVFTATLYDFKN